MLKVICVKLGTLFEAYYVNNLYAMCKRHIHTPFEFFCYTDDTTHIHPDVRTVNYIDHDLTTITHNKLFIFSREFDLIIGNGPRMFLDLDLIIKSDITFLTNINHKDAVTVIDVIWRSTTNKYASHNLNSSCITWISGQPYVHNIWNNFIKDVDYNSIKYNQGMDIYLHDTCKPKGTVKTFPLGIFYSFLYGVDRRLHEKVQNKRELVAPLLGIFPIVILNGLTTDQDYLHYFKKYYSDSMSVIISSHKPL